jgi:hypothetical protein
MNVAIDDLRQYIETQKMRSNVLSKLPSADNHDLLMSWIRRFHSEYDDAWFSENEERLYVPFKGIWDKYWQDSQSTGTSYPLIDL